MRIKARRGERGRQCKWRRRQNGDRYRHGERDDVGGDGATGPVPLEECVGDDTGGLSRGTYGIIIHLTVSGPNPQGGEGGSVE